MKKTVPYITGDGVGVEITPAMQAIVNAAVKKAYGSEHEIEWTTSLETIDKYRSLLAAYQFYVKNNTPEA